MYYVGLDIHQRSTSVEILDCNGKLVKRGEWKLPWPQLADQLEKDAPAPFAVCFEASCGYGFLFEEFSKVAQMVKAAHPGSLRLIYKSKRKNKRVELQLKKMSDPRPGAALLMTIPGIGPRTAEALVAYIDNANRFSSVRKAGSYFGWDPCQDASADKNRLGHITRDGPPTVRKLLVEAAWQSVRRSPTIKAFYDRVTHNDPDRKKIAIVATAHYLTRVAVSMLKSGQAWREDSRLTSEASSPGEGRTDKDPKCSPLPRTPTAEVRDGVVAPTPLPSPVSSGEKAERNPAN